MKEKIAPLTIVLLLILAPIQITVGAVLRHDILIYTGIGLAGLLGITCLILFFKAHDVNKEGK